MAYKPGNKREWGSTIRNDFRQIITVMVVLSVLIIAALQWYEHKRAEHEAKVSDYYHSSETHFLKAQEIVRSLQLQMVTQDNPSVFSLDDYSANIKLQRILQEIERALTLQNQYQDSSIEATAYATLNLAKDLGRANNLEAVSPSKLEALLVNLNQLIRLHQLARQDSEAAFLKTSQNIKYGFFVVLVALLGFFAFSARRGYQSISKVIEMQKEKEAIIHHQAHYDALTDLPNRFLLMDRLKQQIADARREDYQVAVTFMDLDNFKRINDTMGHDVGDELLITVAERLKACLRECDTVGRLGGDEFVIILGHIRDNADTVHLADKIIREIGQPMDIKQKHIPVTTSLGIALFPHDSQDATELLSHADAAMYHAKDAGKNQYSFFSKDMNEDAVRRVALEEHLHQGLEKGEFYVVLQPKYLLATDDIVGAEALLRWHNDTLGQVRPDEFIAVAETSDDILALGMFVLKDVIRLLNVWRPHLPKGFKVAINLSPRQFSDPQLVNKINQSLMQHNVAPDMLELEITEGVLMSKNAVVEHAIAEFNRQGISLAMDDFGTGYASMSYLRTYPFDVLKIDRSFVNDIETDKRDRELVSASISMAHSLNLSVVAEGIETDTQLALLKDMGCEYGQGYFYSKPLEQDDFLALLKRSN